MSIVLVVLGGAAGVLTRYGLGQAIESIWTVVAINLAGCFLLGLLVHVGAGWSPPLRDGLGIGFLGGFTTFSTFALQVVLEADGGRPADALAYLAVSVLGGVAAGWLGYLLGRSVTVAPT